MDKVIGAARSLGKILQTDERYERFMEAQAAYEADIGLQEMIESFHGIRGELSAEMNKDDKDTHTIGELDTTLKALYKDIFASDNMRALNEAKGQMDELVGFINQIVTGSSNGANPDAIEYASDCGGSCSSCSGCGG